MTRSEVQNIVKDIDISILGIEYLTNFINGVLEEDLGTADLMKADEVLAQKPYKCITTGDIYHTANEMVYGMIKQTVDVVTEANVPGMVSDSARKSTEYIVKKQQEEGPIGELFRVLY